MQFTKEQVAELAKVLRDAHAACVTWESMAEAALKHLYPEGPDQNDVPIGSEWFDGDRIYQVIARVPEEDSDEGSKAYLCSREGRDYIWYLPDPDMFERVR